MQLELLLAVDSSLSVSDTEFRLQMKGLARAFRNPRVAAAIRAAGDHGIAVALLQWGNNDQQSLMLDWTYLRTAAEAQAFGHRISRTPRAFVGPGTAIAAAMNIALPLFLGNRFRGDRLVMDISGDGIDNRGPPPRRMRDRLVANGITINGLAILNEDPDLDYYYSDHIIGGNGAFVMVASDYRDFAEAILNKLVREISSSPVALSPSPGEAIQAAASPSAETDTP